MGKKEILHEFPSKRWSSSELFRHTGAKGSDDIIYTHFSQLRGFSTVFDVTYYVRNRPYYYFNIIS